MQAQQHLHKRESLVNKQNRFGGSNNNNNGNGNGNGNGSTPESSSFNINPELLRRSASTSPPGNGKRPPTRSNPQLRLLPPARSSRETQEDDERYAQNDMNEMAMTMGSGDYEVSPELIEARLAEQDRLEMQEHPDDEREFAGGKKLYDRQLMQQPIYDEPTMQILNDIAADESFPILVQYITQLSHLGRQAQARLIARAAAFQSKNQVFSNIQNQNDYMMAQDDYAYAAILSKADFSTYDTNADYFTAEAIMEAQFNIRLRRSRNALNLLQINTQRSENIMGGQPQAEEERKLSRKIPFLGQYMG